MDARRKTARWFLTVCVLLLLTVSCTEENAMASGIEGSVIIGPACPESQDVASCEQYKPFETTILVRDTVSERDIATVQADASGKFRIELPPGEYIIESALQRQFVPPYAEPQIVTVHQGEFTTIEIVYDSGIR